MNNTTEGSAQKKHDQQAKLTMTAISISVLLAIVCIGINSYLVWHLQNRAIDGSQVQSVVTLAEQVNSVDQRITELELGIDEHFQSLESLIYQHIASLELSLSEFKTTGVAYDKLFGKVEPFFEDLEQLVARSQAQDSQRLAASPYPQIVMKHGQATQIVQRGDSVWSIARRFQNPPSAAFIHAILELNNIQDPLLLRVGTSIIIPEHR